MALGGGAHRLCACLLYTSSLRDPWDPPALGEGCAEWRVSGLQKAALAQAEFISAEHVKGNRVPAGWHIPWGRSRGIVSGLKELGYTVELVP